MFRTVDTHQNFLRPSYTLTSAVEALLDPLVAVLSLMLCVMVLEPAGGPHYVLLAVLTFAMLFPGNVGFHERPRRVVRKVVTNWLLVAAIIGGFGYASGYLRHFPRGGDLGLGAGGAGGHDRGPFCGAQSAAAGAVGRPQAAHGGGGGGE